ncbi:E3 ubiquitin-protein ligase TRIM71 [Folsomia candida]|nr:E3 ubiquitin-protein ligase TRIM71 [Folsomia candida]
MSKDRKELPRLDLPACSNKDEDASPDSGYNTSNPSSPTLDDLAISKIAVDLARFLDYSAPDNLLEHISLVLPFQSFLTSEDAMFLITAQKPATQQDLERLAIVIVGPNNVALPILNNTAVSEDGILYTFRSVIPGIHTIDIFHNAIHPIRGCPMQILFSRNYQRLTSILTWELPDKASSDICNPWGLCYNTKTEQLWIADRINHNLIVYKPDGTLDFVVGQFGAGPGEFFRPTALAYDANSDRIFVSDKDNHRIQIFDAKDGAFLSTFGSKGELAGQFQLPWGIAVSPDGSTVAVADTRNHRIQFFDAAGNYLREFRVTGPKGNWKEYRLVFNYPRGLAFNLTGDTLYVSDFNLQQVHQLRLKDGQVTLRPFISPGILHRPSGLAVDEAGNLIVADTRNDVLRVFTPNGDLLRSITTIITDPLNANIRFKLPTDLAIFPKKGLVATLDNKGRVTVF